MKLNKAEGFEFEVDVKRFYLPYKISDECPTCGETVEWDYYLSYPVLGKPVRLFFGHEVNEAGEWKEHSWERRILLDITVIPVEV